MSDDDWDVDDDVPVIAPAVKSKWAEEDEEDVKVFVSFDNKDSWDADSEEEKVEKKVEKPVVKKASPPPKKKSALKQKLDLLKQKEEEKAAQKLVADEESEFDRKIRLKNAVLDSDLENVKALVGDLGRVSQSADLPPVNLASMNPTNREELVEYASMLSKKCSTFEDISSYPFFVETVVRDLVVSLSLEDTRKVSACINAMINEKQKAFQSNKGKKKKKAGVVVSRLGAMETFGDDAYDEFDDFM